MNLLPHLSLKLVLITCTSCLCFSIGSTIVQADIIVNNRVSSLSLNTTNFGGITEGVSTGDAATTFNQLLSGTDVHTVPGGGVNTGTWSIGQLSSISSNEILASGHTDNTVSGNGIGILIGLNDFVVEFENTGDANFILSGTHEGTMSPGANDAIEISLSEFDGVAYQTLYAGDLNADPFTGTFDGGRLYRLSVNSRSFVQGNASERSAYDLSLSVSAVPEPSSAIMLCLAGLGLAIKRRRVG